jgi:hypothetical protein
MPASFDVFDIVRLLGRTGDITCFSGRKAIKSE